MKNTVKYLCVLFVSIFISVCANAAGVSGGGYHTVAVKNDGTVWSCGAICNGTVPVQAVGLSGMIAVAAGEDFSLALKDNGTIWGWGSPSSGKLGAGATNRFETTPVEVLGISQIIAIAAGSDHSLALENDGTVWAWGWRAYGQIGDGSGGTGMEGALDFSSTPARALGLSGVIAIGAGRIHSLALRTDGTVWSWGDNCYGQLGDGTRTMRLVPVQMRGLSGVVAVDGGWWHSLALRQDGTVWAWGANIYGQLGDGNAGTTTNWGWGGYESIYTTIPLQTIGLSNVIAIAAGELHSLALKSDGTVWAWGHNRDGQLGNGESGYTDDSQMHQKYEPYPVKVPTLSGVIAIAAGDCHSIAVKNNGTVWAWGNNCSGQLGDGTTTMRTRPVQVLDFSAPTYESESFGAEGYAPVAGDFDGDGKADEAVYEEPSGNWFLKLSSSKASVYMKLGESGCLPVPADYDADGITDLGIYQESTGYWYILFSGNYYSLACVKFGEPGYTPIPGDYDGDSKTDLALYQESTGSWYFLLSGNSYSLASLQFGGYGYKPVSGDYDGDGKRDLTLYQEATGQWHIFFSLNYTLSSVQFGGSNFEPMPGDYDGDGKTDVCVYDSLTSCWYMFLSDSATLASQKFGEPGYTPAPGDYDGDGRTDLAVYDETTGYWYIQPSSNY